MARLWQFQIGTVTVMPRQNHPGDFDPDFIDKIKLRQAITYASQMTNKAFVKISELRRGVLKGADELEVQHALAKYFSVHPSDEAYGAFLAGITKVYMKIKLGLDAPYDIVVFDPTDKNAFTKAVGYVRPTRTTIRKGLQTEDVSPIRKLLGIPDEWNHQPWTGYAESGRIHISLGVVLPGPPPPDHVARTLVHEASHKFARTNDVLYKHQSFGKSPQDLEKEGYVQATFSIGGRTITPMAGAVKGQMISPDRYIENADSYAWAARRLWKKFQ